MHGWRVKMQPIQGFRELIGYDVGEAPKSLADLHERTAKISKPITYLQRNEQVGFHDRAISGFGAPKPLAYPQRQICQPDLRRQLSHGP